LSKFFPQHLGNGIEEWINFLFSISMDVNIERVLLDHLFNLLEPGGLGKLLD
jgi:hypothetical protein